jgi:hypothetical protein
MDKPKYRSALIVGTGPGLSASLARLFAKNGLAVAVAARQIDKLEGLARETGAAVHKCNAADPKDVAALFDTSRPRAARPTSWSTTRARGCAAPWSTCHRTTSGGRSRSAPSAPSWSRSRRPSACCPRGTARSCYPERLPG